MPEKISLFVYPDRLEVRYVSGNGSVRRNRDWVNVSAVGRALGELDMPSVNRGKFAPDEIAKVETGRELRRPPGRSSSAVGNRYELAR